MQHNTVLFQSFGGQYNDNAKYISEELHRRAPNVKIRWVQSGKSKDTVPSYAEVADIESFKYRKYIWTSKVLVDNHFGIRSSVYPKKQWLLNIIGAYTAKYKKGQYTLSTWHGTTLKKIAMDEPNARELNSYHINCNVMLSGCSLTTSSLKHAFDNSFPILECGTPRNDILLNDDIDINELKDKLGLPKEKRIVLYAPTFRNEVSLSGASQLEEFNYEALLNALSKKFGGEWCFVPRVHNLVLQSMDFQQLCKKHQDVAFANGNLHDDMAEYLKCTDVLITDYSSSMFDYALTGRPCFLLTPDLYEYEHSERGFYFNISETPFPLANNSHELEKAILEFDNNEYDIQIARFLDFIGNKEDGRASEKTVDYLLEKMNS